MNCKSVTPTLKLELVQQRRANGVKTNKSARICSGNCRNCPRSRQKSR